MSRGHLLLFALVCASFFWQQALSSPARAMGFNSFNRDAKIPRTIRAPFRNREMMTARGFGKRSQAVKYKEIESPWLVAAAAAKNEADPLDMDPVEQMLNESTLESFPIDWLVDELVSSPVLAKALLSRFVDTNKDGILSSQELLSAGGQLHRGDSSDLASNDRF